MAMLGPIIFEDANGNLKQQVTYTKHPSLRPYQIAFQGVWHVQNRCEHGVWVYRALPGANGSMENDPCVKAD